MGAAHPDTDLVTSANPYLTFQDVTPDGQATAIVEVIAVRDGALLGTIKWFGRWRAYAFHPEPGCVFDFGCLHEITQNTRALNTSRRLRRKPR